MTERKLLICIINHEEKLEDILSGFLDLGVTGATVVRSEGMGRVLSEDLPVFAGLQAMMARSRPQNTTILSVIDAPDPLDAVIAMVRRTVGDLDRPGTGILFTVPVETVIGLAPELDTPEGDATGSLQRDP